jgi:hypothetical protein
MREAMRSLLWSSSLLLISAVLTTGCVSHARVYAPFNYFSWNDQDAIYYSLWERDTHRAPLAFTLRTDSEMQAFWKWRNGHHISTSGR